MCCFRKKKKYTPLISPFSSQSAYLYHLIRGWSPHSFLHHNNPHIIEPLATDLWLYGQSGPLVDQMIAQRFRGERLHSRSFVRWNKSCFQLKISWGSLLPSVPNGGLWKHAQSVPSSTHGSLLYSAGIIQSFGSSCQFCLISTTRHDLFISTHSQLLNLGQPGITF